MAGLGSGGLPVRLQQLKMQLRMTINAILDPRVHADGMTEAEAMGLMMERGHQEEGEAAGKWRRAQLTSTQLSTYYVGYVEVADLAAGPPGRSVGPRRHDAMLAHGSPAPAPPAHPARSLRNARPAQDLATGRAGPRAAQRRPSVTSRRGDGPRHRRRRAGRTPSCRSSRSSGSAPGPSVCRRRAR